MTFPFSFPFVFGETEAPPDTILPDLFVAPTTETKRLAAYIKGKPNIEAILDAIAGQVSELVASDATIVTRRYFSAAYGVQLDGIGQILGETRSSADDGQYFKRLQAKIIANGCSGGFEEIYSVMQDIPTTTWTSGDKNVGSYRIIVEGPAQFRLFVYPGNHTTGIDSGILAVDAQPLLRFLRLMTAAGVRGQLDYLEVGTLHKYDAFAFDGTPTFDDASNYLMRVTVE